MKRRDLHKRLDKLQGRMTPDDPVVIVYDPNFFGNADVIAAGLERQAKVAAEMGIENFDPSNPEHLDRYTNGLHAKLMLPANGTEVVPRER